MCMEAWSITRSDLFVRHQQFGSCGSSNQNIYTPPKIGAKGWHVLHSMCGTFARQVKLKQSYMVLNHWMAWHALKWKGYSSVPSSRRQSSRIRSQCQLVSSNIRWSTSLRLVPTSPLPESVPLVNLQWKKIEVQRFNHPVDTSIFHCLYWETKQYL